MEVYNPLDKLSLAKSIEGELLSRPLIALDWLTEVQGAGVYAIYYSGPFQAYGPLVERNQGNAVPTPIYVGKAMPSGGRKGVLEQSVAASSALRNRLAKHGRSISEVSNLEIAHFSLRFLPVDVIWIPLGENMLVRNFAPVWNQVVEGFGINAPGKGRKDQRRSQWDVIHPGRKIAEFLPANDLSEGEILDRVARHLRGENVTPIAETVEDDEEDDAADQA